MNRRTFLKLSALTGTAVGGKRILGPLDTFAGLSPQQKTENIPKENWISTSCLNCSARCAIRVRVLNGRAVKITGNPLSSLADGKICPRGHLGLQVLYDPARTRFPLKRTNKEKGRQIDPKWIPISWEEAIDDVIHRLKSLRDKAQPHKLLLFSGLNPMSSEDLISRFANAFGTPNLIFGNGLDGEAEKSGRWMADGHYSTTAYDLDHTNYILAFGAQMLESSIPLSRFLRKWGKLRREKSNRAKIVVISPRYSATAAKADEWIPIRPGTDSALAMGIANVILSDKLYDSNFISHWTTGFDFYKNLTRHQYSPGAVSIVTGIPPETIQRIAREFAQTQPAIALGGKESLNWPEGSYTSYAIFCLNALVGSIDGPGGVIYQEYPKYQEMPLLVEDDISRKGKAQPCLDLRGTTRFPAAQVVTNQIPESLLADGPYPIELAIGFNSNFNLVAPRSERWDQALRKIPYSVHISPFVSEMALSADLFLPSTTFLEEWGYDHCSTGAGLAEVRLKQPVVNPLGEAKAISNIVFQLSKNLKGVAPSFANLGDSPEGFVKFRTSSLMPWEEFLRKGVWTGPNYQFKKYPRIFNTPSKKFEFVSGNLGSLMAKKGKRNELNFLPHYREANFLGKKDQFPFVLIPYQPLMVIENGSQNYPWAQEIFLPMNGMGWETLIEINREVGERMGFENGQMIWVESPFGKIEGKVKLSDGIHPEVVAIASGQGHYAYGKWQQGVGINPHEIIGVDYDCLSGQAAFFNTRVKIYKT